MSCQPDPPIVVSGGDTSQPPLPIAGGALPMDPPFPADGGMADL